MFRLNLPTIPLLGLSIVGLKPPNLQVPTIKMDKVET
jgi:hypothetical protein